MTNSLPAIKPSSVTSQAYWSGAEFGFVYQNGGYYLCFFKCPNKDWYFSLPKNWLPVNAS